MPARATPVRKRKRMTEGSPPGEKRRARLKSAPEKEQMLKRVLGEPRSGREAGEKKNVPMIKPNGGAEVVTPRRSPPIPRCRWRSGRTALLANQSDVPKNWERTRTGRIRLGRAGLNAPIRCTLPPEDRCRQGGGLRTRCSPCRPPARTFSAGSR